MRMPDDLEVVAPSPQAVADARASYQRYGMTALPKILEAGRLRAVLKHLHDEVGHLAKRVSQPHDAQQGVLGAGHRFGRLDPADAEVSAAFTRHGIHDWSEHLAHLTKPWLQEVTSYQLAYDRPFLLVYREGDYIGPHGDTYQGHRINLQLPVVYGAVSCMRVLQDGFLECKYDRDGHPRILGPRMWHEVPPLLRSSPDVEPLRLVLSLRMTGVPTDPSKSYRGQVHES